ncbi:MAG: hypothetical protein MHM6MM_005467 [Cercozoa sp. M6MM]
MVEDAYERVRCRTTIFIHPSFLPHRVRDGLESDLNSRVLKYDESLGGIMLAYKNLKLVSEEGRIFSERPHVAVPVQMDALVKPLKAGEYVEGVVTHLGKDHVGVLLLGALHVAIVRHNIDSERWQFHADTNSFVDSHATSLEEDDPHKCLQEGSTLRFKLVSLQVRGDSLELVGALDTDERCQVLAAGSLEDFTSEEF